MTNQEILKVLSSQSKSFFDCEETVSPEFQSKKPAIVVSHCMDQNGAPMALLSYLKSLQDTYALFVISPCDGDLREAYLSAGFPVFIVSAEQLYTEAFRMLLSNVSFYLCNTIVTHKYVFLAYKQTVPTIWWIHEAEQYISNCLPYLDTTYYSSPNITIAGASKASQNAITQLLHLPCHILPIITDDFFAERDLMHREDEPVRFFMPANLTSIKGPDILAKAIMALPKHYLDRAEFYFAGAPDLSQPGYCAIIEKLASLYDNVHYLGFISHDEIIHMNQIADCVVAPSRTDCLPTTIVEGMMMGNVCICSNHAGISKFMHNKVDGFIFDLQNTEELTDLIKQVIDHIDELQELRINGRALYETLFSKEASLNIFNKLLALCNRHDLPNQKHKVSIIIPCYNAQDYLKSCIDSILNQTLGLDSMEMIFINDASTDDTLSILTAYEKAYPENILVINCAENGGCGKARNIGLSYCSGDYITFMDADDIIHPKMLENLLCHAIVCRAQIVECSYMKFCNDIELDSHIKNIPQGTTCVSIEDNRQLLLNTATRSAIWGKLYDANFIHGYNLSFTEGLSFDDCYFSQLCATCATRYYVDESKYYYYRTNSEGITWNLTNPQKLLDSFLVQKNYLDWAVDNYFVDNSYQPYAMELEYICIQKLLLEPASKLYYTYHAIDHPVLGELLSHMKELFPDFMENPYLRENKENLRLLSNMLDFYV